MIEAQSAAMLVKAQRPDAVRDGGIVPDPSDRHGQHRSGPEVQRRLTRATRGAMCTNMFKK